ncbi:ribonuclease H II [Mycoplasmopsis maculosa]|uniref:Ribonuclease HII n=1 Tax=Mycoplasmopsis maculosa TaxID=114885 RepID=A0A449B4Q2_9BACT|nr:ribonuclease HII [Mycoplasmopsis maculosa]VEU75549.1 ribonuclease H II [Mycoplasmopsis maculosa]
MLLFEKNNFGDKTLVAGFDEAGRGCCAGPLVVASVIMPRDYNNDLINDSKKLNEKTRNALYEEIINNAIDYSIVFLDAQYVDENNPKQSSKNGMKLCLEKLSKKPEILITDFENIPETSIKQLNLVKGDSISFNVACASILAKVSRDRYMIDISSKYPEYFFDKHKGYGTKLHQEMIEKYGTCKEHRLSYKNVKLALEKHNKKISN